MPNRGVLTFRNARDSANSSHAIIHSYFLGRRGFGSDLQTGSLIARESAVPTLLLVMAPALKGPAHPAEHGHDFEANAITYSSLSGDPTPRRPREIICELLNYQLPLQVTTHVGLGEYYLLDKIFLKATKILVHHARQGHMPDHLATARQLKLAATNGDISALQLYRWGMEARTPAYMAHIAQRRKTAKNSQQAPAVPSTEDQSGKVAKDHLRILEEQGDVRAAKRFRTLEGACKF